MEKSLYNDDLDVILKSTDLQVPDIQGAKPSSAIRVKAVKSLLPICLHWSLLY
jgi:hypothetical protein